MSDSMGKQQELINLMEFKDSLTSTDILTLEKNLNELEDKFFYDISQPNTSIQNVLNIWKKWDAEKKATEEQMGNIKALSSLIERRIKLLIEKCPHDALPGVNQRLQELSEKKDDLNRQLSRAIEEFNKFTEIQTRLTPSPSGQTQTGAKAKSA